jgi:hypothetical protein
VASIIPWEFVTVKKQAFVRWAVGLTVVLIVGGFWLARYFPDDTIYVDPASGCSLRLPSSDWKKEKDGIQKGVVSFAHKPSGAVLTVGSDVAETQDSFQQKASLVMKSYLMKLPLQRKPNIIQGKKNDKNNPYLLAKAIVEDPQEDRRVYFAMGFVWCQSKRKMMNIFLSGPLLAGSPAELDEERVFFDKTIDAVVDSVE